MAKEKITVEKTRVTLEATTTTKNYILSVDGKRIAIPVEENVFTHFNEQFVRKSPTPLQKRKYTTVKNMILAAYKKGIADGAGEVVWVCETA